MSRLIAELDAELALRAGRQLARQRRSVASVQGPRLSVDGRAVLHFGSNDYLGLAGDATVIIAAREGASRYGVGAGASHLVSGHFAAHDEVERELATWVAPCAGARALLFSSGYLANLAVVTALVGRRDAVFADRRNHACLNDAAILSRADFVRYPHDGVDRLEASLAVSRARRKLIATDAVFSMDGDLAPLPRLLDLADQHDAWLLVDDAHGFGVLGEGRGTLAHFALASERIVYMGTLGKAAGVAGAFVAAHPAVIETLLQTARSYVYTTASPPLLAAALSAALELLKSGAVRRARLFALIARWRALAAALPWPVLSSATPIQPLIVGDAGDALELSAALWERGIWVPAIRPPTVPAGKARLRITLSAAHREADVDRLAETLAEIGAGSRCCRAAP
ncbi:MAG TPA: 8-amino-7-oxononanoate synthase [Casimicrobiaceae bacterium]|nr:8-amino-7-oxononanoate synthase [Casimicrobiaceae bacterium]